MENVSYEHKQLCSYSAAITNQYSGEGLTHHRINIHCRLYTVEFCIPAVSISLDANYDKPICKYLLFKTLVTVISGTDLSCSSEWVVTC